MQGSMTISTVSPPTVRTGRWLVAAGAAAVVPVPFLIVLVWSLVAGRPALAPFARGAKAPVARRLTLWWAVGIGIAMLGEAVGAALGIMNILTPWGLVAHCAFGLTVIAVLTGATARAGNRP